jgi:hypothetical protein
MNFIGILLALSLVIALVGSYGATKNAKNTTDFKRPGKRSVSPRLHFVEQKQFANLYESDHVLFQLQRSQAVKKEDEVSSQRVGITLRELEKCIPWVPGDTRVFICSPDGFGPSLLKKLNALDTQRDLFLVESLPRDLSPISMVVS